MIFYNLAYEDSIWTAGIFITIKQITIYPEGNKPFYSFRHFMGGLRAGVLFDQIKKIEKVARKLIFANTYRISIFNIQQKC
jgi:hypothetical protein